MLKNLPVCYPDSFSEYFDQGPCSLCPKVGIKESILPLGLMMMKKHKYKGRSNVEKPPREVPQLRHTSRVAFQSLSFFLHYVKFWHHTFRWSQVSGSHLQHWERRWFSSGRVDNYYSLCPWMKSEMGNCCALWHMQVFSLLLLFLSQSCIKLAMGHGEVVWDYLYVKKHKATEFRKERLADSNLTYGETA